MCNRIFILHSHSKTIQKINLIAVFGMKEKKSLYLYIYNNGNTTPFHLDLFYNMIGFQCIHFLSSGCVHSVQVLYCITTMFCGRVSPETIN